MAKSQRDVAEELIDLHVENAELFAKIDILKEKLREFSAEQQSGFREKFAGKGEIQVSAGSVARLKGIMPTAIAENFLKLSEARRAKLIADKIIEMKEEWTKDRSPSVTVRLG